MRKYRERFSEKNVENAFLYLLNVLDKILSKVEFSDLKKVCKRDRRLSKELRHKAVSTSNVGNLLDVLSKTPSCNWMEIEILKSMASVAEIPEAERILEIYEDCIFTRKCSEVKEHIVKEYINEDVCKVIDKIKKNPEMTVGELNKYRRELGSLLNDDQLNALVGNK